MATPTQPRARRLLLLALATTALFTSTTTANAQRGYELVTPPDDLQYDVGLPYAGAKPPLGTGIRGSTADGRHVVFELNLGAASLPGMALDGEITDSLVAFRGEGGWGWRAPLGDRSGIGCKFEGGQPQFDTISDDGRALVQRLSCPADKEKFSGGLDETLSGLYTLYSVDVLTDTPTLLGGKWSSVGPIVRPADGGQTTTDEFVGGSLDLSTIYFAAASGLTPDLPVATGSESYLYKYSGGLLSLVTQTFLGLPFATLEGERLDRPFAVSDDGGEIGLTVRAGKAMVVGDSNVVKDVYQVREGETLWVSSPAAVPPGNRPAPQPAADRVFEAGSADASKVYFSTTEQMTADDTDTVRDIYVYDVDRPGDSRIERVSTQDEGACAGCDDNLSSTDPLTGSGANFSTVSADGTHSFFVTGDVLSETDDDAQPSLYAHVLNSGATTYIAPAGAGVTTSIDGADAGSSTLGSLVATGGTMHQSYRRIKVSADGTVAAFSLATNYDLPAGRGGADADDRRDLFVWREGDGVRRVRQGIDADTNESTIPWLGCFSRRASHQPRQPSCRGMSADGDVVFLEAAEPLVASDTNELRDVYAYHTSEGSVELISPPGGGRLLITDFAEAPAPSALYVDNSASGDDVFFLTRETLDPSRDRDGGRTDIYNARVGGGFPPLPEPPSPCAGDGCQPSASGAPPRLPPGPATPGDAVESSDRLIVSVRSAGRAAVRRAALTGRLPIVIRSSGPATLRVRARARIGRGVDTVARGRKEVGSAGRVRVTLQLSQAARRALRGGRALGVRVEVRAAGARPGAVRVVLREVGK